VVSIGRPEIPYAEGVTVRTPVPRPPSLTLPRAPRVTHSSASARCDGGVAAAASPWSGSPPYARTFEPASVASAPGPGSGLGFCVAVKPLRSIFPHCWLPRR